MPRPKLVFFTGENVRPPVGKVPLCISFDHIPAAPPTAHVRLPLWILNGQLQDVLDAHERRLRGEWDRSVKDRNGFCCWVASNASLHRAGFRAGFVQALGRRYKPVACGGEVLNNVGGPVKDKLAFLHGYRFNICFENDSSPGYCTEKIMHAHAAGCVPIYWGDPHVSRSGALPDFNPAAVISAHDYDSPEDLIRHIAAVDQQPELLEQYLSKPILSEAWHERLRDWRGFRRGLSELIFMVSRFQSH